MIDNNHTYHFPENNTQQPDSVSASEPQDTSVVNTIKKTDSITDSTESIIKIDTTKQNTTRTDSNNADTNTVINTVDTSKEISNNQNTSESIERSTHNVSTRENQAIEEDISSNEQELVKNSIFANDTNHYVLRNNQKEFSTSDFKYKNYNTTEKDSTIWLVDNALKKENKVVQDTNQQMKTSVKIQTPNNQQAVDISFDWIPGVLLLALVLLAWIRIFYYKYIGQIFSSVLNYSISNKLLEAKNAVLSRVNTVLNFLFVLSLSLFVFEVLSIHKIHVLEFTSFNYFLICFGFITSFYLIKTLFIKISGHIFDGIDEVNEYLHNMFIINKTMGILLLPIVIALPYVPDNLTVIFLYSGYILISILLLISLIRSFQISIKINLSIFYLILYLCTLEILPFLLVVKFFKTLI